MTLRDELTAALANANLRAFFAVIRAGEGTADAAGYRRMFGGELVTSLADHPRRAVTRALGGRPITSTAAGAYQFLSRTWDECAQALALPDFSPASQDLAAAYLIRRRGAMPDVLAGRIADAITKCNREWASLPGSPYGQPTRTMAQALAVYAAALGAAAPAYAAPDAPHADLSGATEPPQLEQPPQATHAAPAPIEAPTASPRPAMPPFLLAAIPSLIQAIPALAKLFGSGGEVAERNVAAVQTVATIVQDAVGARNIQEAVEAIQSDPAMARAANDAVQAQWFSLAEAGGGGIDGAREADRAFIALGVNALRSPAFVISCVLMVFPMLLAIDLFFVHPGNYAAEIRTQIVTAMLLTISMVGAFWLGSSFGSQRKDEQQR